MPESFFSCFPIRCWALSGGQQLADLNKSSDICEAGLNQPSRDSYSILDGSCVAHRVPSLRASPAETGFEHQVADASSQPQHFITTHAFGYHGIFPSSLLLLPESPSPLPSHILHWTPCNASRACWIHTNALSSVTLSSPCLNPSLTGKHDARPGRSIARHAFIVSQPGFPCRYNASLFPLCLFFSFLFTHTLLLLQKVMSREC